MMNPMANANSPRPRLLIVDDDDQLRQTLVRRFQRQGLEVTCAANAEEAVAKLSQIRCDVGLLALKFPGESGIELLQQLKELQPASDVHLVTAHSSNQRAGQ